MDNPNKNPSPQAIFWSMWEHSGSRGWLRIDQDGEVRISGQETGRLTIIARNETPQLGLVLVLHEEGRSYWSARGERGYAPSSYLTVLLGSHHEGAWQYVALVDSEPPKNAQERESASAAHCSFLGSRARAGGPSHSWVEYETAPRGFAKITRGVTP